MLVGLIVSAGLLALPGAASAINFVPATGGPLTYSPDDRVRALAAGDFDGDSLDDIASVGDGGMNVTLGVGDGSFMGAGGSPFGASATRHTIFAADLNGDGDLDLLTRNGLLFESWLGNGDGTFPASPASTVSFAQPLGSASSAALKNVDGDTDPDLIVGQTDHQFAVALNNGSGVFTASPSINIPTTHKVGQYVSTVAIGDYDGNGTQDAAFGLRNSTNIYDFDEGLWVANGNGAGVFTANGPHIFGGSPATTSFATLDLNGDAFDDLSSVRFTGAANVFTAIGSATSLKFGSLGGTAAFTGPTQQVIADLNDDGLDDIAVTNPNESSLSVALNKNGTGDLTSLPYPPFLLPKIDNQNFAPSHVVSGDFNDDGLADLAADSADPARGIQVMINSGEPDATPDAVIFPETSLDSTADQSLTLENKSPAAGLDVDSISIGGADAGQFEVVDEGCHPLPRSRPEATARST